MAGLDLESAGPPKKNSIRMDRHAFADRYSIGLTYKADDRRIVPVTDLLSWQHKEAIADAPTETLVLSGG
jgi:hypothetical protein